MMRTRYTTGSRHLTPCGFVRGSVRDWKKNDQRLLLITRTGNRGRRKAEIRQDLIVYTEAVRNCGPASVTRIGFGKRKFHSTQFFCVLFALRGAHKKRIADGQLAVDRSRNRGSVTRSISSHFFVRPKARALHLSCSG